MRLEDARWIQQTVANDSLGCPDLMEDATFANDL
jgi:hypothetical protein